MRTRKMTSRRSPPKRLRPRAGSRCSTSQHPALQRSPTAATDPRSASLLERLPHLDVALRGPDPRIHETARLVIGAGHVERHAMVEDGKAAELRSQLVAGVAVDLLQRLAGLPAGLDVRQQLAHELACLLDREA